MSLEFISDEYSASSNQIYLLPTRVSYESGIYHTTKFDRHHNVIRKNTSFKLALPCGICVNLNHQEIFVSLFTFKSSDDFLAITLSKKNPKSHNFNLEIYMINTLSFLKINTNSETCIGEYYFKINYKNYASLFLNFLVIFNPYDKSDDTYIMENPNYWQYLETDSIITYSGGDDISQSTLHLIKQFSKPCIDVAIIIIKEMDISNRIRAYEVSKFMSKWVNSDGFLGILTPSWKQLPLSTRNPKNFPQHIFKKYLKRKIPLEFGQCVDFNVILCSLLRMLGIGCRVVTGRNVYYKSGPKILRREKEVCWNGIITFGATYIFEGQIITTI